MEARRLVALGHQRAAAILPVQQRDLVHRAAWVAREHQAAWVVRPALAADLVHRQGEAPAPA